MFEGLSVLGAVLIGFLGSAHCLGMCGGISSSLGMAIPVGPGFRWRQGLILLGYNSGRIVTYGILGLIVAFPGQALTDQWAAAGMVLRSVAGIFLIIMGLSVGQWWQGARRLEAMGAPLWRRIAPYTQRLMPVSNFPSAFVLGSLWGWLPCGLVYSTLGWAAMQGTSWQGGLLMLCFGVGTLPAMLATGYAARQVQSWQSKLGLRRLAGGLIILFGIWTLPVVQTGINRLFH
ncbi:sulfite exporter TauE/SafE family protein [Marinobacteraceae bacterium S3BR75-40.1]